MGRKDGVVLKQFLDYFDKYIKIAYLYRKSKKLQMKKINKLKLLDFIVPIAALHNSLLRRIDKWKLEDLEKFAPELLKRLLTISKKLPEAASFLGKKNQSALPFVDFFGKILDSFSLQFVLAVIVINSKNKSETENQEEGTKVKAGNQASEIAGMAKELIETFTHNIVYPIMCKLDELYHTVKIYHYYYKNEDIEPILYRCKRREFFITHLETWYTDHYNNYFKNSLSPDFTKVFGFAFKPPINETISSDLEDTTYQGNLQDFVEGNLESDESVLDDIEGVQEDLEEAFPQFSG